VPGQLDIVANYALSLGFKVTSRTILVEGTTDVEVFQLAARLEFDSTGIQLLDSELSIVAAGHHELGGTNGVLRELICLRGLVRTCLLPNGRPRYRFIGLFDNDKAGRQAIKTIRTLDTSILEYKDVFRLHPLMPVSKNLDPTSLGRIFESQNAPFKGLDWELEDLLPDSFIEAFAAERSDAIIRDACANGKTHREFTKDGKARLFQFIKQNALRSDVLGIVDALKSLRCYLGLK
jgi:hypothetical protein